ncbi:MAG: endonuclease [Anaerolineales bacterium]|nr:MAG: endonuclease [Anaerolineales bacterium]
MPLKITNWNIEHAEKLLVNNPSAKILDRRRRILETLEEITPDILCIQEGPDGEQTIEEFCTQVLNNEWIPVLLRQPGEPLGARDSEYQMKGNQWVWFLVKPGLKNRCKLQSPTVWQSFVGAKTWTTFLWGEETPTLHSHFRHPQVLLFDVGNGRQIEIIGVHLKSKISLKPILRDANGNLTGEFLRESLQARIKLATEARNVRQYVEVKFKQVANPGLIVMGDCNDGPGIDEFENKYLFFDLITNIQGDVLISEKFFNHALFDFPDDLSWSAKFADKVLGIPESQNPLLLDHILLSQPLCRGDLPLQVNAHAGLVEHEAYERHNVGANSSTRSSDHRPVSCRLDDNP